MVAGAVLFDKPTDAGGELPAPGGTGAVRSL